MRKKVFLKVLEFYSVLSLILFSWNIFFGKNQIISLYTAIMCLICIMIIFKEKINILKIIKNNKVIILTIVLIFFTSLTSLNRNTSINTFIILIITAFYSILLSAIYNEKEFYSILNKYFILSILFSFLFIIFYPENGLMVYEQKLLPTGVYSHKNVLARYMVIANLIFLNNLIKSKNYIKKITYALFQLLSILLIIISESITGLIWLIALSIANIIIINKYRFINLYLKIVSVYCFIFNIFVYFISNPKIYLLIYRIKFFGKNLTFTGRNSIWNFSFIYIFNRLFTGYGIDAFWSNNNIKQIFYYKYKFNPPHAHNGYLALLLDGGIILLVLFIYIIYKSIISNINNKNIYNLISIMVLTFILLINLTESAFVGNGVYLFWIILCFKYSLTVNNKIKIYN